MGYNLPLGPPNALGIGGALATADRAERKRYARGERGSPGSDYRGLRTVTAGGMANESGIVARTRQSNQEPPDGQTTLRPGYLAQRPGAADIRLEDWNTLGVASRNAISSTANEGGDITAAIKEQADRASAERKRDWLIRSRAISFAIVHGISQEEAERRIRAKLQKEMVNHALEKGIAFEQATKFGLARLQMPDF